MDVSFVEKAGAETCPAMERFWCNRKAGKGVITQIWNHLEGHVMKRKTDWWADKPVISENAREEDVIAALTTVIILCNMVFVNSVVMRLSRASGIWLLSGLPALFLCNTTQGWCIRAWCQILFPFGDLSQCFPSNTHLKKTYLWSVNQWFDQ